MLTSPCGNPQSHHYQAIFWSAPVAPVRPRFTTLVLPPLTSLPHIALEQLRSKHLPPPHQLDLTQILAITG